MRILDQPHDYNTPPEGGVFIYEQGQLELATETIQKLDSLQVSEQSGRWLAEALEAKEIYVLPTDAPTRQEQIEKEITKHIAGVCFTKRLRQIIRDTVERTLPAGTYKMGKNVYQYSMAGFFVWGQDVYGKAGWLTIEPFGSLQTQQASMEAWLTLGDDMLSTLLNHQTQPEVYEQLELVSVTGTYT